MYKEISIDLGTHELSGHMMSSDELMTKAWIIFSHGSGSSRKSQRNNWVARELNKEGFGTILFDLLTPDEDEIYLNRFNIPLMSERLLAATSWLLNSIEYNGEKIGYFGASTGAAAAIMAAAKADESWPVFSIVSRGGRPDLAGEEHLAQVRLPTLLIVGSHDDEVIKLNKYAQTILQDAKLVLVPGARHLFEEPGALEEVSKLTTDWFSTHLDESRGIKREDSEDFRPRP